MNKHIAAFTLGLSLLLAPSLGNAAVILSFNDGTLHETTAITTYTTTGALMGGMSVTVFYVDTAKTQFENTAVWAATGADSGSASGSWWSLTQAGDSFSKPWTLANEATSGYTITGFEIFGGPLTVFDVVRDTYVTENSFFGKVFQSTDPRNVSASYSDVVRLSGQAPLKDLYLRLRVTFMDSQGLLGAGGSYSFIADTDTAATQANPVPVPAALWLLGSALVGGLALKRSQLK